MSQRQRLIRSAVRALVPVGVASLIACGGAIFGEPSPDGGAYDGSGGAPPAALDDASGVHPPDSGVTDGSFADAAGGPVDAAAVDATVSTDAAARDAETGEASSAAPDAASLPDSGSPVDAPTADAGSAQDASASDAGSPSCPTDYTLCDGGCVNEATDNSNCGACGHACTAGTFSCVAAACESWLSQQPWGTSSSSANALLDAGPSSGFTGELFAYDDPSSDMWLTTQTFAMQAIAGSSIPLNYAWAYTGNHEYFLAFAELQAFADGPGGRTTVTLVSNRSVFGPFSFHGTSALSVTAGYPFGFIASGANFDFAQDISGEVTLTQR